MVESYLPVPQHVTLFRDKVFTEVMKMRSLGLLLIQYDRSPYKKEKPGHRQHRESVMWT